MARIEISHGRREWLFNELKFKAYNYTPEVVRLASGSASTEYVDCSTVLNDPVFLTEIARAFLYDIISRMSELGRSPIAVAGVPSGASGLSLAVSMLSLHAGMKIPNLNVVNDRDGEGFYVEGLRNCINESQVFLMEDVITTGASIVRTIETIDGFGASRQNVRVTNVLVIVDREQGGAEDVERLKDVKVRSLFKLSELRSGQLEV